VSVLCGLGDLKGSGLTVCVHGRLPRACVCGGVLMCLCIGGRDAMRCMYSASASWTAAACACVRDGDRAQDCSYAFLWLGIASPMTNLAKRGSLGAPELTGGLRL
jgi:hypothetical protein